MTRVVLDGGDDNHDGAEVFEMAMVGESGQRRGLRFVSIGRLREHCGELRSHTDDEQLGQGAGSAAPANWVKSARRVALGILLNVAPSDVSVSPT